MNRMIHVFHSFKFVSPLPYHDLFYIAAKFSFGIYMYKGEMTKY